MEKSMASILRIVMPILLVFTSLLIETAVAQNWMDMVHLTGLPYNGSGVAVILISTGADMNLPVIDKSLVRVDDQPCFVVFDSKGVMYPPSPPYDLQGIGTQQALTILSAAPAVHLIVARVPYEIDPVSGMPIIPAAALRAALNWSLNPYIKLPNGTKVSCNVYTRFRTVIVLVGLPVYNYTLDAQVASLLRELTGRALVVAPVGDAQPGIFNVLAKVEGVLAINWFLNATGFFEAGLSGGYTGWRPRSIYRDLPISPSYSMPVNLGACYPAVSVTTLTCSELAAAEFTGLAAVAAQVYYELRGVSPTPSELENLIRASVHDLGAPGKDSIYGWGSPDAAIIYKLLSYNAGFIVCAPSYNTGTFAVAELYAPPDHRYSIVMRPGECIYAWGLPGVPYQVTVYSSPSQSPATVTVYTFPGYWSKVHVKPVQDEFMVATARLVDEKGVSLQANVTLLPGRLWPVEQRWLVAMLHPLHVEAGNMMISLSCSYLSLAYGEKPAYLLVSSPGMLSKILELPTSECGVRNPRYGTLVFAQAPSVYLVGVGPGAEEDVALLRMLGFRVEIGLEAPDIRPDVVIVHPSGYSRLTAAKLWTGHGLVIEGHSVQVVPLTLALEKGTAYANPIYQPGYQPILARGVALYTLYGLVTGYGARQLTVYNISVSPPARIFVLLESNGPWGRIIEAYFDLSQSTVYLANLWSLWRMGKSLWADASVAGLAALQLAVAAATGPIILEVNGHTYAQIKPLHEAIVTLAAWRIEVTLWNETLGGKYVRLASFRALYPGYQANYTLRLGIVPAGVYTLIANDTLWRLGYARYAISPFIILETREVLKLPGGEMPLAKAGGTLRVIGYGFHANTSTSILFDGVAIASGVTDSRGKLDAIVPVPSVAPPGNHSITVTDGYLQASAKLVVRVEETLQVLVSAPSVVFDASTIPVTIITRLGAKNVDANVTVFMAGRHYKPARITRGVYYVELPPQPPGSYVILVNASLVQPLIEARGVAAVGVTVERRVKAVTVSDLHGTEERLATLIEEGYEKLQHSLSSISERLGEVENLVENASRAALDARRVVENKLNSILAAIGDVRYTLMVEVRRIGSSLADKIGDVAAKVDSLSKSMSDLESRLVSGQEKRMAKIENLVKAVSAMLNQSMASYAKRIETSVASLQSYLLPLIAALGVTLGVVLFIAVCCVRSRRK